MKTRLSFLFLSLLSISLLAQEKDFNFRFEAGGNLSNIVSYKHNINNNSNFLNGDYKLGYQIGGFINYNFGHYFYASSGLNFITKGFNSKNVPIMDSTGVEIRRTDYSTSLIYIQVPVQLGLRFPIKDNHDIDVLAGGYFGFAVIGNEKFEDENNNIVIRNFFDELYIIGSNRFDVGLKFSIAYNFYNMYIAATYDWGMYKFISHEVEDLNNDLIDDSYKYHAKNSTIGLSLGVKF